MNLLDDNYCFACGKDNPIGLKLEFKCQGDEVSGTFTPRKEFEGWQGVVHGGIIATILDEAMAKLIIANGETAVTSRMDIRFLRPVVVGEKITIKGKIQNREKNKITGSSKILNESGKTLASCSAVFVISGIK